MIKKLLGLLCICLPLMITAAPVYQFYWTAPLTNTDGSELTDLAGFTAYCGTSSGNYTIILDIPDPLATTLPVTEVVPVNREAHYCAFKAYDSVGDVSVYSNEVYLDPLDGGVVVVTVPAAPSLGVR